MNKEALVALYTRTPCPLARGMPCMSGTRLEPVKEGECPLTFEEIRAKAIELEPQVIAWRRQIHRRPEVHLDCAATAHMVAKELERMGYEVRRGLAKTGVVGLLRGAKEGPLAALRVDMDALPLQEETGLEFASEVDGVMHACGHDGHTAIGLGVAELLSFAGDLPGCVLLVFQPGEEYPGGASLMIQDGALDPLPGAVFGLHIFPGVPLGRIGLRYGNMTARNDEFLVDLVGTAGHGAYPHKAVDPFPALAAFINATQSIVSRNLDPFEPLVISLGEVSGGGGHNVIPAKISLKGIVRSLDDSARDLALRRMEEVLASLSSLHRVGHRLEVVPMEPPLACDPSLTRFTERTIKDLWGPGSVVLIDRPSLGVDDFAYFAKRVPATYMRLGTYSEEKGYVHPLHSSRFDFDEAILSRGVATLAAVIRRFLESKKGENE